MRYEKGIPTYIKAIDNHITYDSLTGNVKKKLKDNSNLMVIIQFDQSGEDLLKVDNKEWNRLTEGDYVKYHVDTWGHPSGRMK